MAKKITRGITGIKDINKQDFDTNNVNDLLSDGQYNYIHRKKGKSEEYHNLTDNIKTISSDNTDLLTVTNNNKTNNTATLSPKHDAQKEQVLESERNTVTIKHGTNATTEKTKVDTNPQKVLEHSNLLNDYGISKTTTGNTTKLGLEYTLVDDGFDLNTITNGLIRGRNMLNAPSLDRWYLVESFGSTTNTIQKAVAYDGGDNTAYVRWKNNNVWEGWRRQVGDKSTIDALLAQKQNKLTAMGGISITGNSISLTVLDPYEGDLNDLTYTCLAKPVNNAPNIPAGGYGILTVVRIGDVVSQKYHLHDNTMYARSCRSLLDNPTWSPWVKVRTEPLS